jgi:hypothetical protein
MKISRCGWVTCLLASGALAGCELEEITVVDVEDVVLAEVYIEIASDPAENRARAFLHRTLGTGLADSSLVAATVTLTRSDGFSLSLVPAPVADCVESETPDEDTGICFTESPGGAAGLGARDLVEMRIDLPGGGTITGATRVPGSFDLPGVAPVCRLDPDTLMPLSWSRAEGAWAYLNEASIRGLPEALEPEGIVVEDDPLYLLGLSISETDTTIVFPSEFGVFNRFALDADLSIRLQEGLPPGTRSEVTITAIDRNYVNWVRGGNFNPSGQVRIPSLQGDGTGVFGSAVVRRFEVLVTDDPPAVEPACPIGAL